MQKVLDRIHLSYIMFENHHFHLPESQNGKRRQHVAGWIPFLQKCIACLYFPSTVCEKRGISCNDVNPETTDMGGPREARGGPWSPPGQITYL